MGSFSAWHWIVVLVIVLIVFGAGRLPRVMGDLATGIKTFKKGMADDTTVPPAPPPASASVRDETPIVTEVPPAGDKRPV